MAKTYQSPRRTGKLFPSATPDTLRAGRRASEPREPISRGSSFYPLRILGVIAFFAAFWVASFSGCTRLDL